MSTLAEFWPLKREVETFCVQQAEVAHECVTLSVHQKLAFNRIKEGGSGAIQKASENDLLDAVLTPSSELTDGFKFIVISGYAGVGKSHYISWINSQLIRTEEANNFHVVWVRKHDTLRTILQSILLPFKDLAEFARILDDLDKAILNNQGNAGYSFQAGMNSAIDHEISNIKHELQAFSGDRSKKDEIISKQKQIAFFDSLKFMFNEPSLLEHWTGKSGVFSRILNQVIQGKNFENIEDEEHLFHEEDLIAAFSEVDIAQLNTAVSNFYETKLRGSNAESNLNYAIGLLNGLVDKATNFAFQFNQNMGGKSFRDLLGDIRRKLFTQNKELVFLIEDFYAMAGLQDELLPTFIFGGSEQDKICNIRTVLAVTEDFFVNRSTTMSHRKDEFVIDRVVAKKEDQLDTALDMVGAYLNATRVGANKLVETLKEYKNSELQEDWVPTFQSEMLADQESALLSAFGVSPKRSYPLFPFSKHFVMEFLERRAKIDGDLTFSARGIVRNLLLENLSSHRDLFEEGLFPDKNFSQDGISLQASLENKIRNLRGSEEQKGRLKILIKYWANGDEAVSLDQSFGLVAEAFELGDIWQEYKSEAGASPSLPIKPDVRPLDPPRPPDGEIVSSVEGRREVDEAKSKSIDAWGPNAPLTQTYANDLRNHIIMHITLDINFIDLINVFGKTGRLYPKDVKLPDAAGNNNSAFIDVGIDEGGRLRLAYFAFERASLNKSDQDGILYDYPGGFNDRVVICEFIEPLKRLVVEKFKSKHLETAKQSGQLVPVINSLEVQKIAKQDIEDLSALAEKDSSYDKLRDWAIKANEISEHSSEIQKQYELVANISQGMAGGKPFCRNLNEIGTLSSATADFTDEFKREHLKFFNTFIEVKKFDRDAQRCLDVQHRLMKEITEFFEGSNLDFENDKEKFKTFLEAIKKTHWPGEEFNSAELSAMFSFLDDLNLAEYRLQINKFPSQTAGLEEKTKCISAVNLPTLVRSHFAVSKLGDFFEAIENILPDNLPEGDETLPKALQEVETALNNIKQTLEEVS